MKLIVVKERCMKKFAYGIKRIYGVDSNLYFDFKSQMDEYFKTKKEGDYYTIMVLRMDDLITLDDWNKLLAS